MHEGLIERLPDRATVDNFGSAACTVVMTRATLFRNGGSQAVRLPREYRFSGEEVLVHREGRRVVLEPTDEWPADFLATLGAWKDEIERPKAEKLTSARDPFERR